MRNFLIFLFTFCNTAVGFAQNVNYDTLSVMNFDTYEESISLFPSDSEQQINLTAIFGGVSINLLENKRVEINRDSLLVGLSRGMQVLHDDQVIIKKNDSEKITIINNEGIVVRTISGLLGLMPEEIEPFLRIASEAKLSGFKQRIGLNGKYIPMELSFKLK